MLEALQLTNTCLLVLNLGPHSLTGLQKPGGQFCPTWQLRAPCKKAVLDKRAFWSLKQRLKQYYRESKVESTLNVKKPTLKKIKSKGGPCLRAKAGQASCLIDFIVGLAKEFQGADGELGNYRSLCMDTLSQICALCKQDVLTEQEVITLRCKLTE